jgi:hypothetical protein
VGYTREVFKKEKKKKARKSLKLITKRAKTQLSKKEENKRRKFLDHLIILSCLVIEISIISFPPQAPQKARRNHLPHNNTPRAATRPPANE